MRGAEEEAGKKKMQVGASMSDTTSYVYGTLSY